MKRKDSVPYQPMNKATLKKKIDKWEKRHSLISDIMEKLPPEEITVRIQDVSGVFCPFDVNPPENRAVSAELGEYLLEKVDSIDHLPNLTVNLVVDLNGCDLTESVLCKAFENHFEEKTLEQFEQNRKQHKKWRFNFMTGFILLGISLLLSQIFSLPFFEDQPVFTVIRESLSVIGCVALWEPTGYLLFGRKENNRLLRNYALLHRAHYRVASFQK